MNVNRLRPQNQKTVNMEELPVSLTQNFSTDSLEALKRINSNRNTKKIVKK